MKQINSILIIIFLLFNLQVNAEEFTCGSNQPQTFEEHNFQIRTECKLFENKMLLEISQSQPGDNLIGAYHCAANEHNMATAAIYSINIHDLSSIYDQTKNSEHHLIPSKYIDQYAESLSLAGISYEEISFKSNPGLIYNFLQQDIPTKALFFVNDRKVYLIQVASRSNVEETFQKTINSFAFLN